MVLSAAASSGSSSQSSSGISFISSASSSSTGPLNGRSSISGASIILSPANLENLEFISSGLSTFVIMSISESGFTGIASIIIGVSSASKPSSSLALYIRSLKSSLAFSVPYASSVRFICIAASSDLVSVHFILFSFIRSNFI